MFNLKKTLGIAIICICVFATSSLAYADTFYITTSSFNGTSVEKSTYNGTFTALKSDFLTYPFGNQKSYALDSSGKCRYMGIGTYSSVSMFDPNDQYSLLQYGSTNSSTIEKLQLVLKALNYRGLNNTILTVDGKFGNNTKNAVISFQTKHGLKNNGIVGYYTWTELAKATY